MSNYEIAWLVRKCFTIYRQLIYLGMLFLLLKHIYMLTNTIYIGTHICLFYLLFKSILLKICIGGKWPVLSGDGWNICCCNDCNQLP